MTPAHQLLQRLQRAGVTLWAADGKLRYKGPRGALSATIRVQVRQHKAELLELVGEGNKGQDIPQNIPDPLTACLRRYGSIKAAVSNWVQTCQGRDVVLELPGKDRDGNPRTVVLCTTKTSLAAAEAAGRVCMAPLELVRLLEARAAGLEVPMLRPGGVLDIKDAFEGGARLAGVEVYW